MSVPAWDLPLAEKIKECQEKCGRTYGYRRVHIWLERNDIHRNPKTILRVMQKYGLLSVIRRKKYRNYGDYIHKYPNLLNRNFSAERPNQKWVTDISYIHTKQGVLYLSVILSAIVVGVAAKLICQNKKSLSAERALCVLKIRKSGTELFTSAVSNSAVSMLTVCAYVTFFSSLLGCLGVLLERWGISETFFAAIFGFFEISGGVGMAAEITDTRIAILLAAAILGWSGLSVHLQISSVCKGRIDLRPYFLAKLAQSTLCGILAYGLWTVIM